MRLADSITYMYMRLFLSASLEYFYLEKNDILRFICTDAYSRKSRSVFLWGKCLQWKQYIINGCDQYEVIHGSVTEVCICFVWTYTIWCWMESQYVACTNVVYVANFFYNIFSIFVPCQPLIFYFHSYLEVSERGWTIRKRLLLSCNFVSGFNNLKWQCMLFVFKDVALWFF